MPETRRPVLARRGEPECQAEREHDDPGAGMLLCWLLEGHDGDHFDTYDGWWPSDPAEPPLHHGEGITGMYWDNLGSGSDA